jgi:hypothetical protein
MIDKEVFIQYCSDKLIKIVRFLYRWITHEGEVLGYILGTVHFMISTVIGMLIIISHTIYPSFWLQLFVFTVMTAILMQHIFLKVCISVVAEQGLTNNVSPFYTLLNDIFGISANDFINFFVVAETALVGSLGLELMSRCSVYLQGWS